MSLLSGSGPPVRSAGMPRTRLEAFAHESMAALLIFWAGEMLEAICCLSSFLELQVSVCVRAFANC